VNYIAEAEKVLRNYRRLQLSVALLEKKLSRLCVASGPSKRTTATLELSGIRASKNRSAEQIVFEIMEIQGSLMETKEEIADIDQLLVDLSAENGCEWYGNFLRAWYVDKQPKEQIENVFSKSKRSLYNMRDEAIKAFAVAYFGIRPLKGM